MLNLHISGPTDELKRFLNHFQSQSCHHISAPIHIEADTDQTQKATFSFEFLHSLLKPSLWKGFWVELYTEDQEQIRIHLLDGDVVNMGNGCTLIYGKNYDIFEPKKTPYSNNEAEGETKEGLILL